jgi:hypothetical protein
MSTDLFSPCWCKVFIDTPESGSTTSPLLNYLESKFESEIRFDFTFVGCDDSDLIVSLVHNCPGISRIYQPLDVADAGPPLNSDATREFAFSVMAVFRSGVTYALEYRPSRFLAHGRTGGFISIPVLPAATTSFSVEIKPPETDPKLRFQCIQCVIKYVKWNPKTNRLSRLIRIVTQEFKIANRTEAVMASISYPLLFASYLSELQSVEMRDLPAAVQEKMRKLRPVLVSEKQLRPIILMAFLLKSHPAFSAAQYNRLAMGSALTLAGPKTVVPQFSYSVELWRDCETFVEAGLNVAERKRKGDFIFLVKSFPSVLLLSKTGKVDVPPGSALERSIDAFREACQPLTLRFVQCEVGVVPELLSVDEEEGLAAWLESVGLESMRGDIS